MNKKCHPRKDGNLITSSDSKTTIDKTTACKKNMQHDWLSITK